MRLEAISGLNVRENRGLYRIEARRCDVRLLAVGGSAGAGAESELT